VRAGEGGEFFDQRPDVGSVLTSLRQLDREARPLPTNALVESIGCPRAIGKPYQETARIDMRT
jgi:hypothetical protein